jgi:predicted ATPase/class 3 adenylate cyclase
VVSGSGGRERDDAPAADLPAGTLTFLFTDVVGSTALWERHPAAMRSAIARHDALIEEALARHGGRQVKERGEGDSVFAVFTSPSLALAAACALQRALLAEPWPAEVPIRVRAGLHSGEADPREGGYYGLAVNRAARLRSLAHGGQVLLSQGSYELARDALPEEVRLRSLGRHELKGLERPEGVYQVLAPGLPAEFPPLASPRVRPTNLPAALSSFVGRGHEGSAVRARLGEPGTRLLTLTGVGGMGKTRLALEVAGGLLGEYPDGVLLAELAPLAEPALLPRAVAAALGLHEEAGRALPETLIEHLRHKTALLLLDNCEHLVAACAELARSLLRSCPHLRILATSRQALRLSGEARYPVPGLSVPDPGHLPPPELVGSYEAVRLFVARAQEQQPLFVLTEHSAPLVAAVCARLDGMPLAIELAAARIGSLPLEAIAERLDVRLRLLAGGPRDLPARQRTLRATMDWSWELLEERERALLRRLAVFAGGWTLPAAEALGAAGGVDGWEVLDLLDSLTGKSLVQLEETAAETRYGLLETVREYSLEALVASGEEERVREVHATYCLALAEQLEPILEGPGQEQALRQLAAEHDNLGVALEWALASNPGPIGLRLAAALQRYWTICCHFSEGRRWLAALLDAAPDTEPALRARALQAAGALAYNLGDLAQAEAWGRESLRLLRALGDLPGIALVLHDLGNVVSQRADYDEAVALFEESLALRRSLGDRLGMARSLHNLGTIAYEQGDYPRAVALLEEPLAIHRELGDLAGTSIVLGNLGALAMARGELARARELLEESLALRDQLGDRSGYAFTLMNLGTLLAGQGEAREAVERLRESVGILREVGDRKHLATALNYLARVHLALGDPDGASGLCAESMAIHEANGDRRGAAEVLLTRGRVGAARGNHAGALASLAQCMREVQQIENRALLVECLEAVAAVHAAQGDAARAARLCGATAALRDAMGAPRVPAEQAALDRVAAGLRGELGEEGYRAAWRAGAGLSLDAAVGEAIPPVAERPIRCEP